MPATDIQHIMVGVDRAADAQLALEFAIAEANRLQCKLTIASVIETSELSVYEVLSRQEVAAARQDIRVVLDNYAALAKEGGVPEIAIMMGDGMPGRVLVNELIPSATPDMLVIGASKRTGLARHIGSQAAYLAKYAPITTVIVR